jgi:protein involved in polysaccharide export with SLBB domain
MQKRVEWILQQLNQGGEVKGAEQSKANSPPILKDVPVIGSSVEPKVSAVPPTILGPGDVVNIEIFNLIEQGEWYKATRAVDAEGNVRLPVVGDISVGGHRPKDVEVNLVDKLKDKGILADPIVAIYACGVRMIDSRVDPAAEAASTVK